MTQDWRDALSALRSSLPEGEEPTTESAPEAHAKPQETLHVLIDRRQRKGKTATIVEGFLCDDDRLKEIAGALKQKLGTGGSARGGEILLQGDWRDKAAALLREMGYKVK